jgi:hypothetical protein
VKLPLFIQWICVLGLLLIPSPAATQLHDENAVKAALVFNLTKYVEWPQSNSEFIIGFIGEGSMGEVLKAMLDGKASESRTIHVLLSPSDTEIDRCNILFIAEPSPKKLYATLDRVRDKSILTVGDSESFARAGGMIGLVTSGDLVKIQVRLQAAQDSHLKISSRLLNIAVLVPSTPEVKN